MFPPPQPSTLLQGCEVGDHASPLRINLAKGETLALLGTGQTSVLRAVAATAQTASIDRLVVRLVDGAAPVPADRTVAEILRLGLPDDYPDSAAIVARWLHVLGLSGVSLLSPLALGGDAQRRVALGRALVGEPSLLLLDDPFRGCDPDERRRLGEALRLLQQHNGMGMILATRYAPDARAMADRIMVLRDGQLVQEGDSVTLYEQPSCAYAARALGEVNLIPGHTYEEVDGLALVIVETGAHVEAMLADAQLGQPCWVTVRPERLAVAAMSADEMGEGAVAARVISLVHHGDHVRLVLSVGTTRIVARRPPGPAPTVGAEVCIAWQAQNACAVQREGA